jgi:phosphatidylserine/phosphatidylglycerophosphate/cardiolipin synthase-like enzyme
MKRKLKKLSKIIITTIWLSIATPAFALVQVAFSPNQGAESLIIANINKAEHDIKIASYQLTSKPILRALHEKASQGVRVYILLDRTQTSHLDFYQGLNYKIDYKHKLMHNKFIIIDSRIVETGSYNYSANAEHKNAENVIVIDDANVVNAYIEQWKLLNEVEAVKK